MIERGLSHSDAGKIGGILACSRVMSTFKERRRSSLAQLSEAERYLKEVQEEPWMEKARLSALLLISDAISHNCIS